MFKRLKNTFFYLVLIIIIYGSANSFAQPANPKFIFFIEKIEIEGNNKTKDYVIYENITFAEGDSVPESEIHQSIENLNSLEIFSKVTMQPNLGSAKGNLVVTIKVEERYWPHVRFKGGYNELEGWFLTPISLNFDNILGFGNFISLDLTLGDRINAININYLNPNIFDSDLDFITKISGRALNFVHYIDQKKWIVEVEQSGIFLGMKSRDEFLKNFTFGFDFYNTLADTFGWRYNSDDRLYEFPTQIDNFTGDQNRSANFKLLCNIDWRDYSRYPSNGLWFGGMIDLASKELGSKYSFVRYTLDIRKYLTIYKKMVLASRVKYGFITFDAPFYEKFYLGGPNSLRGYDDRSLSPLGGGNQIVQAGMEVRLPITTKNFPKHLLSGVIFYDIGENILSKKVFDFNDLKSSYGFGLRMNIPFLGVIRADYGIPADGSDKKIQFSLGHIF